MTIHDVMKKEREALLAEYLFPQGSANIQVPPYAAVPNFGVLQTTPSILRGRYPIRIEELPGKKPGQAYVQVCPGLDYKFLWTHVDNDDYRGDYGIFLRKHYGIQGLAPAEFHVDHLYNLARARSMQLPYVRMVLLPAPINTSHGAGYEKARTQGGIGTPGRQRGVDEIILMKLFGVPSPRKGMPLTPAIRAHLGRIAILFKIPVAELERNIQELMDVARFRPGS